MIVVLGVVSFPSTLTLKSSAIASGRYVTLYDLAATFNGISVRVLKNFKVAFSPQPGTYYTIDAKSVKARAENEIKWLDVLLTSNKIKVSSRSFTINLVKVQQALASKLSTNVFIMDFPTVKIAESDYTVNIKSISEIDGKKFALVEIKANGMNTYANVGFETDLIGRTNDIKKIPEIVNSSLKKKFSLSLINNVKAVPEAFSDNASDQKNSKDGADGTLSSTGDGKLHSSSLQNDFEFIDVGKPFILSKNIIGVPVNFISSSKVVRSVVLKYTVHEYKEVVVAANRIEYGQKITRNSLKLKKLDVYATTTAYATSIKECAGKIALWSFLNGQVVSMQGLKSPPDVVVGQILIAYISYPTMMVTTFVRVMQNGNMGQVIPVRNIENGYMMYGTIEKGPKIRIYSGGE